MAERSLHLDPELGYVPGPVPADLAEGLDTDGSPLGLKGAPVLDSLQPPPAPAAAFDWEQALESLHGAMMDVVPLLQWLFLLYFIVSNGSYIFFNLMSLRGLLRFRREQTAAAAVEDEARGELPISLVVPVRNQADAAVAAVRAMLHLTYSAFEIIIVNDGSGDETLDVLLSEFSLVPFPEVCRDRMQTRRVRSVYASTVYPNLRLVDKYRGGRADALNAGINCARYPLYCGVDVAHVLHRDALRVMGRFFVDNPATVAACSAVRTGNGCEVKHGFVVRTGLPRKLLALLQVVEPLRVFLPGRMWWSDRNAMLVLPGAFTLFRKEVSVAAGAYRTDVIDEEMELILRLHRLSLQADEPYRISLVPVPVCWETVPETIKALKIRQVRRQRALSECLDMNRRLLFCRQSGVAGWVAFPFLLLIERLGPLIELLGYATMIALYLSGAISPQAFGGFMLVAIGMGVLLSVSGLAAEELSLRTYPRLGNVLTLFVVALLENFGYRQLAGLWRAISVLRWMLRMDAK